MPSKSLIGLVAVIGLFLWAGCGAQPGKTLVSFENNGVARMSEAPADATYALYSRSAANPDVTYELRKGDPLGFAQENGKTYAVAGTHKDEIKTGMWSAYYWKMQNNK